MSDICLFGVQQSPLRFISVFLESINCKSYLELGVFCGESFSIASKVVNYCVGVDKKIRFEYIQKKESDLLYEMTTDDFFAQNKEIFDVIFIDASHVYEQVKKDFCNSIKVLNSNGFILLHDTDPSEKKYVSEEFCGDAYKIVDYIVNTNNYDIITFPMKDAGLSIVSNKNNRRVLSL